MRPVVILSVELILEIISWLPVKSLIKFISVNKFFKTIIFNPYFIQMHLNKSSRNLHLALLWQDDRDLTLVTLSIPRLIQNELTTFHDIDPYFRLNKDLHKWWIVGSCNGLLCLTDISYRYRDNSFCFWNPATRTKSENFKIFDSPTNYFHRTFKFSFGYDNSTRTYKVVAFYKERGCSKKTVVKVFNLGDNAWREIQCFPVLPLYWFNRDKNNGVHLSGTINWLALRNYFWPSYESDWSKDVTVEQYVIVSLDLSTESYTEMLLPNGFVEVPHFQPTVVVLINCLCFCYDFERSYFVIWQMKDFGVQESWVQLFKISYQHFYLSGSNFLYTFQQLELLPLYLSENRDTLILARNEKCPAYIYNCIDNRVERIRITDQILWLSAKDYIESLVPTS